MEVIKKSIQGDSEREQGILKLEYTSSKANIKSKRLDKGHFVFFSELR